MDGNTYSYHAAAQHGDPAAVYAASFYSPFQTGVTANGGGIMAAESPARTTGLCCHCGRGLPYDRHYFWCLFCDLRFCPDCPSSHPSTHQAYYKWLRDRPTPRGSIISQRSCMKCKRMSHCRMGCEDCELNFCMDCVGNVRDTLASHAHGKMATLRAPDDYGVSIYNVKCESCQKGASLSHCGRCWAGIKKGDSFWACVTCVKDYNGQIRFCEECQYPGREDHDPSHRFASFQYRVDLTADGKYNKVRCLECKQSVSFEGQSLARHPHSGFQITMGELERNRRTFHSYRACARKPVRDIATVGEDAHNLVCQCCNQRFPPNSRIYLCSTCTLMSCETCAESGGSRSHTHILIPLYLQHTIPPDDLWRLLVNGSSAYKTCERCEKQILPERDCYMQCNHCCEWNICLDCTKKVNIPVRHACSDAVEMTFFDPVNRGNDWLAAQMMMVQKAMTDQRQTAAGIPILGQPTAFGIPRKVTPISPQSTVNLSPTTSQTSLGSTSSQVSRQQSFSIKRKAPSAGVSQPAISQPVPVHPIASQPAGQYSIQQPIHPQVQHFGMNPIELPTQQNVLPAIQSTVQPLPSVEALRRSSLSPKLEKFQGAMINTANQISNKIDKEAVKNASKGFLKGTMKVAGAVGAQMVRKEVNQDVGFQLLTPSRTNNRTANQQLQTMNQQMQLQMQTINKLNQTLQAVQAQHPQQQAIGGSVHQQSTLAPNNLPHPQLQNTMNGQNTQVPAYPINGNVGHLPPASNQSNVMVSGQMHQPHQTQMQTQTPDAQHQNQQAAEVQLADLISNQMGYQQPSALDASGQGINNIATAISNTQSPTAGDTANNQINSQIQAMNQHSNDQLQQLNSQLQAINNAANNSNDTNTSYQSPPQASGQASDLIQAANGVVNNQVQATNSQADDQMQQLQNQLQASINASSSNTENLMQAINAQANDTLQQFNSQLQAAVNSSNNGTANLTQAIYAQSSDQLQQFNNQLQTSINSAAANTDGLMQAINAQANNQMQQFNQLQAMNSQGSDPLQQFISQTGNPASDAGFQINTLSQQINDAAQQLMNAASPDILTPAVSIGNDDATSSIDSSFASADLGSFNLNLMNQSINDNADCSSLC